jgi:teichuronic acid biosynthesis glycosyltransferase TuaG
MLNMVSIIMPCYNSERYIAASIESVLGQTMQSWELIVVNDCSSDGTQRVIDEYKAKDSRIIGIELKVNSKASGARNAGIDRAKYKYIAFLDSDDIWLKEKLESQVGLMEKETIPFTFTSYLIMDSDGNINGKRSAPQSLSYDKLLSLGNDIGCSTVIYNKMNFPKVRFDLSIPIHEDYKMWLDMLQNTPTARGIKTYLSMYRVHGGSKNLNKWNSFLWNWKIWREYENQSILNSSIISLKWGVYKIVQRLFFNRL